MKLNRVIALVALLAILVGMIPVQAQDVTIRYFMWDPSFEDTERVMADICAAEVGVTVDMEVIGTPDYWTNLNAMAAAEDLPDVFSMSSGFVDEWTTDGLLYDIQGYVDENITPNADDYFTGLFDRARDSEGNMHAFPFAFVETVLFYNQDAFDAAMLDYPSEEGWTWDEFLAAAQALTIDEGDDGVVEQYGFWFYGRYAHVESWVYQNNGNFLTEDRTRFAADENAVEALAFLDSLIHEYGVAPEPSEMEGIRQQDVFPLGMAAMWVDGAWNISNTRSMLEEGEGMQWAIAPVPRGPNWEEDRAYGWPDLLAVANNTENPDESWAFIECMTGPLRTIDMSFPGKIPIYRPTAEADEFLEADLLPANKGFLLTWAQATGPTSFTPGWGEWRGYTDGAGLQGQLDEVFNGNGDLDSAIESVTEYANGVLERFYPDM